MTARIIDGKARAERLTAEVAARVTERVAAGKPRPGLAVVLVGEHAASQVYVRNKRKTTDAVGMRSFAHDLPANATRQELLSLIDRLNGDPAVHGILVQLPLPRGIDADAVAERIDPRKDVDGLHPYNIGRLVQKRPLLRPCTPAGCMTLLRDIGEDLVGNQGQPLSARAVQQRLEIFLVKERSRGIIWIHQQDGANLGIQPPG